MTQKYIMVIATDIMYCINKAFDKICLDLLTKTLLISERLIDFNG